MSERHPPLSTLISTFRHYHVFAGGRDLGVSCGSNRGNLDPDGVLNVNLSDANVCRNSNIYTGELF
jgi:hypothetical protein